MDLVELSHIAKAQNKRRKKDGKPVGSGKWSGLQAAAARGADVQVERVAPAKEVVFDKPSPANAKGRLIRTITPRRLAIAAIPLSAAGAGYGYYRWNRKTENRPLASAQMRQLSSKM